MKSWRALRSAPTWTWPSLCALVILFLPQLGLPYAAALQVELAVILALVVSGLNLSLGYAGELALGQAAMYAAGAYAAGILSKHGQTDLLIQLAVSAGVALLVGVVTGIPGLRLNSWSLAMTSFFLVLIIPDVLQVFSSQTGGSNGLSGIQAVTLFGSALSTDGLYMAIIIVAILWFAVLRNIVASRHGVAFQVLKQSPILATSQGISVFRMKLLAYALGAIPPASPARCSPTSSSSSRLTLSTSPWRQACWRHRFSAAPPACTVPWSARRSCSSGPTSQPLSSSTR